MSSGPKRIPGRTNVRTQVRSKHGGARSGSGRKKRPKLHQDMRDLLVERMKITIEKPKELGKHWMDHWIIQLRDPEVQATPYGAKLTYEMFKLIFFKSQNSTPRRFTRDDEESEDRPFPPGGIGLPPLKPDSSAKVPPPQARQ